MVVRWVHRSTFTIRPRTHPSAPNAPQKIRIPDTDLYVDAGWYGAVVVEAEGTNEGLADLQQRCGPGAFHALVGARKAAGTPGTRGGEMKRVFRVLREKSRPGEIWIRTVTEKERLQ
jgi:hypothetical protein